MYQAVTEVRPKRKQKVLIDEMLPRPRTRDPAFLIGAPFATYGPSMGELKRPPAKTALDIWGAIGTLMALNGATAPLRRRHHAQTAALSFAQERLWALQSSQPDEPSYNVPLAWTIRGNLNVSALQLSLDFLAQRHEVLRTGFLDGPTGPVQRVNEGPLRLQVVEPAASSRANPAEELLRQARIFARIPFDLRGGPLARAALFRCGPEEHLLVLVVHQGIFDGASLRILSRELAACYAAFLTGVAPALAPLPICYRDFALWQRDCLKGEVLEKAMAYWGNQLRKPYAPLRLPIDHPRGGTGISPGASVSVRVPRPMVEGLKKVARERGVTPFAALLGSWQAGLSLCTGQQDVLSLVTVAARHQPELQNLVGLIANILPMRLDLAGQPGLGAVLERAGQMVSAALSQQVLPLSRILELLPAGQGTGEAPPLQTLVLYNNSPRPTLLFPEVTFSPRLDLDHDTARFDLLLDIADSREGLAGYLKYRADLFEPATIVRVLEHWMSLLDKGAANPSQPIQALALQAFSRAWSGQPSAGSQAGADPAAGVTEDRPHYTAPRNARERTLVRIWERVFERQRIGIHDHFFALGGHSLLGIKLIAAIEKETGRRLPLETIFREPTIARLAQALLEPGPPPAAPSLIEIQPQGTRLPLFLVHGAGGGMIWGYNNLAHQLGTDQPIFCFSAAGGLEAHARIEDLAARYVAELLRFQPRGPYHLGGFCFGGNVAYEMARQLALRGEQVGHVFLLNSWPSHSRYTENLRWTLDSSLKAAGNFCVRMRHQLRWVICHPELAVRWYGAWSLRKLKLGRPAGHDGQFDLTDFVDTTHQSESERRLWRTHIQAWRLYRPGPYPGRVCLLRTPGHPLRSSYDPKMGWDELARGGVEVRNCPGDHATILDQRNAALTARQLEAALRLPLRNGS